MQSNFMNSPLQINSSLSKATTTRIISAPPLMKKNLNEKKKTLLSEATLRTSTTKILKNNVTNPQDKPNSSYPSSFISAHMNKREFYDCMDDEVCHTSSELNQVPLYSPVISRLKMSQNISPPAVRKKQLNGHLFQELNSIRHQIQQDSNKLKQLENYQQILGSTISSSDINTKGLSTYMDVEIVKVPFIIPNQNHATSITRMLGYVHRTVSSSIKNDESFRFFAWIFFKLITIQDCFKNKEIIGTNIRIYNAKVIYPQKQERMSEEDVAKIYPSIICTQLCKQLMK